MQVERRWFRSQTIRLSNFKRRDNTWIEATEAWFAERRATNFRVRLRCSHHVHDQLDHNGKSSMIFVRCNT